MKQCQTCAAFSERNGECRRYPPSTNMSATLGKPVTHWPIVNAWDGCLEHIEDQEGKGPEADAIHPPTTVPRRQRLR